MSNNNSHKFNSNNKLRLQIQHPLKRLYFNLNNSNPFKLFKFKVRLEGVRPVRFKIRFNLLFLTAVKVYFKICLKPQPQVARFNSSLKFRRNHSQYLLFNSNKCNNNKLLLNNSNNSQPFNKNLKK